MRVDAHTGEPLNMSDGRSEEISEDRLGGHCRSVSSSLSGNIRRRLLGRKS